LTALSAAARLRGPPRHKEHCFKAQSKRPRRPHRWSLCGAVRRWDIGRCGRPGLAEESRLHPGRRLWL